MVSYSKKRARKDQHDRQKEIDKLKKKLNRSRKPKEFISASGYKRFLTVSDHERVEINEAAIEKAPQWDGLHGVITNSSESVDPRSCIDWRNKGEKGKLLQLVNINQQSK